MKFLGRLYPYYYGPVYDSLRYDSDNVDNLIKRLTAADYDVDEWKNMFGLYLEHTFSSNR